jgi:hypothetical protein
VERYQCCDREYQVFSAPLAEPQLTLNIYERQSHTMLWSSVQHPGAARREKNREKELLKATRQLADDLRRRVENSATVRN